jgi:uncharacterized membrane protein YbhN (UPF0104 family)
LRRLRIAVPFLLILLGAAWVICGIDIASAREALDQAQWFMVIPMTFCYLAVYLARSHRLRMLLSGRARLPELFRANAIGYMAISIMPLRLGELVRPHLLWQHYGLPLPQCIGAIAVERLLDLAALLVVLAGSLLASDLIWQGTLREGDVLRSGRALGTTFVIGVLLLLAVSVGGLSIARRSSSRSAQLMLAFREGLGGLFRRPSVLLAALADTALVYAFSIGATWCVLLAFAGVPHDFGAAAVVLSFTTIGMSAAPTPGSVGAYEASGLAALLLHGVERSLGATVSIVLHVTLLAFSLGLGAAAMLFEGIRFKDLGRSQDRTQ